jgi:hypothetical protein
LRIVTFGLGTGRQKMAFEQWTNPKRSRRTCTCEYGVQSRGGNSAGVAKPPRERSPSRNPHRHRWTPRGTPSVRSTSLTYPIRNRFPSLYAGGAHHHHGAGGVVRAGPGGAPARGGRRDDPHGRVRQPAARRVHLPGRGACMMPNESNLNSYYVYLTTTIPPTRRRWRRPPPSCALPPTARS